MLWRYILHKAFYITTNKRWSVHCAGDSHAEVSSVLSSPDSSLFSLRQDLPSISCKNQLFVNFHTCQLPSATSSQRACEAIRSLRLPKLSQQGIKRTTHTPLGHNQSLSIAATPTFILYQRTTGKMPNRSWKDETDTRPCCLLRKPSTKKTDRPADPAGKL